MDTPDYLPRPAMRKSLPARELAHRAPERSISVSALAAQGVGRLATLFSRLAWRATNDLTRTGFARAVSHITVLGVTAGALALGASAVSGSPEVTGNVSLRAAAARPAPSADRPLFAGG
ncbi:MAG TPA: hypothetical protein VJ754_10565, partial [Anaerolineae bacterium]|nr:hypothetical protein [Anaerolineae bacterium]